MTSKKAVSFAVCILLCIVTAAGICMAFPVNAHAADAGPYTEELRVQKLWQHGETPEEERPETVRLTLMAGETEYATLILTAKDAQPDGSWTGSFGAVPLFDENGEQISYTVTESPIRGYRIIVSRQPKTSGVLAFNWGSKITPASSKSYSVGSANLVAANKGGSYYVWTKTPLNEVQRAQLIDGINAAGLQGFGKTLAEPNTMFQSGLPAAFDGGAVSLAASDGSDTVISFSETSAWSLFYTGSFTATQNESAVITNVSDAESTPAPTPSAAPTEAPEPSEPATTAPLPTVQPTSAPSPAIPRTADIGGAQCWVLINWISALTACIAVCCLRRFPNGRQ